MINLETRRLTLKPHTPANAEKFAAWENDPELMWLNDDESDLHETISVADARQYLKRIGQPRPDDDIIHFAIHRKADGALIGFGMVAAIDMLHRRCLIGITIGETAAWGQGYGREALEATLDYCFNALNLNRIVAEIYCFNERSIRLFEGLGFKREGTLRQSVWKNGQFWDDCLYALLRDDWERRASERKKTD